jgi:hypothetical protein
VQENEGRPRQPGLHLLTTSGWRCAHGKCSPQSR